MKVIAEQIKLTMISKYGYTMDEANRVYDTIGLIGKLMINYTRDKDFVKTESLEPGEDLLLTSTDYSISYIHLVGDILKEFREKLFKEISGSSNNSSLYIDEITGSLVIQAGVDCEQTGEEREEFQRPMSLDIFGIEILFHCDEYIMLHNRICIYSNSELIEVFNGDNFSIGFQYWCGEILFRYKHERVNITKGGVIKAIADKYNYSEEQSNNVHMALDMMVDMLMSQVNLGKFNPVKYIGLPGANVITQSDDKMLICLTLADIEMDSLHTLFASRGIQLKSNVLYVDEMNGEIYSSDSSDVREFTKFMMRGTGNFQIGSIDDLTIIVGVDGSGDNYVPIDTLVFKGNTCIFANQDSFVELKSN